MHNATEDEYLDLVNEQDEVIGKKLRSEVYAEGLTNFRSVNAVIKNSQGQLWIPRRTAHKRIAPLGLDTGVGGHVESGEDYESTFAREVQEELGVDVTTVPHRLLGHLTPHQHGTSSFQNVYEITLDEVPHYNPDDFIESFWLYPQEVLEHLEKGEPSKIDLPVIIKNFYI